MRKHIRDFVSVCARMLPIEDPVYEFGSRVANGQRAGDVNLRPLFKGHAFWGADMISGPGVDVVLNLHDIDLPDESVGTVVSVETFEHVKYPWIAAQELCRVLKPGGLAILTSTMHYPIHNHPSDYWRYTPDGFDVLLEVFDDSWVGWSGDPQFPHTVMGLGFKGKATDLKEFVKELTERRIIWKLVPGTACQN